MYFRGERLDWGNGLRDAACHGKVQGEYSVAAIYNSKRVSPISKRVCTCWVNGNSVVLLLGAPSGRKSARIIPWVPENFHARSP